MSDIDYGQMFRGIRVFTSPYMTESKEVPRTWRERLFERPWRPFRKTKVIQVPSNEVLQMTAGVIMHPATFEKMRKATNEGAWLHGNPPRDGSTPNQGGDAAPPRLH